MHHDSWFYIKPTPAYGLMPNRLERLPKQLQRKLRMPQRRPLGKRENARASPTATRDPLSMTRYWHKSTVITRKEDIATLH